MKHTVLSAVACLLSVGCTMNHSKQALWSATEPTPTSQATFVTEEDSGLMLLGAFTLAEPDHYAVLLERARRQFRCDRMHHAQLDFYTDHWLIVAFPVSRITLICERDAKQPEAGYVWIIHSTYRLTLGVGTRYRTYLGIRDDSPLNGSHIDPALLAEQRDAVVAWVPTLALRFSRAF